MLEKVVSRLDQFRDHLFYNGRIYDKVLLIAAFSLAIVYLLSPKISFRKQFYSKGEIVKNDIIAEKDLLIPDLSSTELKKKKILDTLNRVFDYNPRKTDQTVSKVKSTFQNANQALVLVQKNRDNFTNSNRRKGLEYLIISEQIIQLSKTLNILKAYESDLEKELQKLKKKKLSPDQFEKKKLLDARYKITQKIVEQAQESLKFNQQEIISKKEELDKIENQKSQKLREFQSSQESLIHQFIKTLGLNNSFSELDNLFIKLLNEQSTIIDLIKLFESAKIIAKSDSLKKIGNRDIDIRNISTNEVLTINQIQEIIDLSTAQERITLQKEKLKPEYENLNVLNLVISIAKQLLTPNITENKQAFEIRKKEAVENLSPVYFNLKKGEMIARRGEKASQQQSEIIKEYFKAVSNEEKIPTILGIILLTFGSWFLVYRVISVGETDYTGAFSKIIPSMLVVIINLFFIKLGLIISDNLESRYFESSINLTYLFPVALSSMVISILFEFQAGFIIAIVSSLFISVMLQYDFHYFLFCLSANLSAALPLTNFDSRWSLMKHGLKISLVNMFLVVIIFFVKSNQFVDYNLVPSLVVAFFGGIITSILAPFLLQFFESIFDLTTNLRLLELSNMNHPALKELMFNAPGTYQHSIVVGNLAESGAIKIGVNPLLTRVGAYYHDLGKTKAPNYFIENVGNGVNGHQILNDPFKSAKKIIQHVIDGVEIAKKYRLGKAVTDILAQHHGTTCVKYFYNEAIELQKKAGKPVEEIDFSDFRYPGPKPQTKASALVMLADASEASTRSLDDIDEDKIQVMVEKVTKSVLDDGQLDESDLTLKEFKVVVETFIEVLTNIYHHRIKYPGQNAELQSALDSKKIRSASV